MRKTGRLFLFATVLTAVFGIIYEHFSYNVFSPAMAFAWLIPLIGGCIPFFVWGWTCAARVPSEKSSQVWTCGIAALTVGSLMKGVLDIYGTTSSLLAVYPVAGIILLITGLLLYLIRDRIHIPLY